RVSSYPAHRLGHIPQCPDGLLGRPLPPLLVSLTGAAPRIAHSALDHCTDAQCLDEHNGLLLSALWNAAFDPACSSQTQGRRGTAPWICHSATAPVPSGCASRQSLAASNTPRLLIQAVL